MTNEGMKENPRHVSRLRSAVVRNLRILTTETQSHREKP